MSNKYCFQKLFLNWLKIMILIILKFIYVTGCVLNFIFLFKFDSDRLGRINLTSITYKISFDILFKFVSNKL